MSKPLLSRKQTAEALSLSTRTLDRLVKKRRIPFIDTGHKIMFDVDKVIETLTVESEPREVSK
jgi:excisionase family DNA binding protein